MRTESPYRLKPIEIVRANDLFTDAGDVQCNRPRLEKLYDRWAVGLCLVVIAISLSAQVGWWTDQLFLAGKLGQYGPMAPAAIFGLLLAASALCIHTLAPNCAIGRGCVFTAAVLVVVWGLVKLPESFNGTDLGLEMLLVEQREDHGGQTGLMTPLSGISFLLAGLSLLFSESRSRRLGLVAQALPIPVLAINIWALWACLELPAARAGNKDETFQSLSWVYQQIRIPVAIPTAVSFIALALALIAAGGPRHFLIRHLFGNSTRAWLLRGFLPGSVALVVLSTVLGGCLAVFGARGPRAFDLSATLLALWTLIAPVLVAGLLSRIAFHLGGALDRAEEDRNQALDQLRKARDVAEGANRSKSQFLANMSHELRTPLNAVIGYSELLQEEVEELGQKDLLSDLHKINAAGKHLLALINDILDISKIEAGRVELCPEIIEVDSLIGDIVTTIRPLMEKNGNRLEVETGKDPGSVHQDVTRLRQCLLNLLSNAAKFTRDGIVTLQASREASDGGERLTFCVKDNGVGMTPDQLGRLFQPFTQADASTTRKYGGTGLGLVITRKLVEMMGGSVAVKSEPSKGSVFSLQIPVASTRQGAPVCQTVADSTPAERVIARPAPDGAETILVVDDDPAARELIQRFLSGEGYRVVTVARGEEVLRLARELRPKAITLDVMMPGMDGWAVLSALKADRVVAEIPVVMLTIMEDRNLGYALGASEYLTKPIARDALVRVLKRDRCPAAGRRALVVEDDPATRNMLLRVLLKDGWTVDGAASGSEALEFVEKQRPGLILLDLMTPGMDGFEFLSEVRQRAEWQNIPVIVITAKDLTQEDRLFLNGSLFLSGSVRRILQKGSFSREELLDEVRTLVSARP
jgi:signal transduction histidine kinase/DNA-binding response OmpR family regulator